MAFPDLALALLAGAPTAEVDAELAEVCGEKPSWFCEAGWNLTGNRLVARGADWFVTRPLAAGAVLVAAWVLNRYLRKAVSAFVTRLATSKQLANETLQRIGVDRPDSAIVIDARSKSRAETLASVSRASVSWFVWTIAILIVLGLFQIDLAPLLAGAGIAGIAVGFGAQTLVRDCISGFFMLMEDQCGVGDEVDLGQASGTVESITLRMTSVRSPDGTIWSVPNGVIQRVGNMTRNWSQGTVDISIWHEADLDVALAAVEEGISAASEIPAVAEVLLRRPTVLGVERIDTTGTVIRITVRTRPGQQWGAMREVRHEVRNALVTHEVPLYAPYPPNIVPPPRP